VLARLRLRPAFLAPVLTAVVPAIVPAFVAATAFVATSSAFPATAVLRLAAVTVSLPLVSRVVATAFAAPAALALLLGALLLGALLSAPTAARLGFRPALTTTTTTPPRTTRSPSAADRRAGGHVVLLAVGEKGFTDGRADLCTASADAEKTAARMVNDLDLDAIARHAELIEGDLDGFFHGNALCFDTGRHEPSP
jgi:hypothetical protein